MILCKYVKTIGHYQLLKTLGVDQHWIKRCGYDDLYECTANGQLIVDGGHAKMADEQGNCLNGLYHVILDTIDVYV